MADALPLLQEDPATEAIALIGEIGGVMEEDAAEHAAMSKKPIAALIAGATAPPGRRIGHAGAIIRGERGSYLSKKLAFDAADVPVAATPGLLVRTLAERLR
jgi:succinyl-CoA synthetase alpha subunit